VQRAGYHVHDGFYLRLGVGLGGGHASISPDNSQASHFGYGGAGLALNLWIGGTPWRGVTIGGMGSYQAMSDSNLVVEGQKTGLGANGASLLLGPFIDAFPDPLRGLHVGGALTLAGLGVKADSNVLLDRYKVKDYSGGGLGASAWVGYMGWVGPEWSMGGMLQLSGFATRQQDAGLDRTGGGYVVNLSFSALYN
jgi:hypothetical protein